ncbi:MAG: flavodoxin [Moraxellaceae bacterium]|nr:flavodoxin [Moraxellaceae bacterium]
MKNIGLFYGSTSGNTEDVAGLIKEEATKRGVEIDVHDIHYLDDPTEMFSYERLIIGIPTWCFGDHQDDWQDFLEVLDENTDLSHITMAFYGLGDQEGYAEWFLDSMGFFADLFEKMGVKIIGQWENKGYDFVSSTALRDDGRFVGLALDEDCQSELTEERVLKWLDDILPQFEQMAS